MKSANANDCPDLTVLHRVLEESMEPERFVDLEAHLEVCASCRLKMHELLEHNDQRSWTIERLLRQRAGQVFDAKWEPAPESSVEHAIPNRETPHRIGGYRILGPLGRGAYGQVYHGYDDALQRDVAIKVPHQNIIRSAGGSDLYLREARALARLDHPHIVRVYQARAESNGACYLVSQFISGYDLAEYLADRRLLPMQAVKLLLPLVDALQHAHERGICHRDVKPANILIDESGKPFLADFGLALRDDDVGRGAGYLGTPAYMSPEQASGKGHHVDGRTDIYSLGVVFFKLLTGKRPFQARSVNELIQLVSTVDPPSAKQKDRTVPTELDRICGRALAREVKDRYRSASEWAEELDAWLGRQTEVAERISVRNGFGNLAPPLINRRSTLRTVGEFQLKTQLGCGGMGVVYRARQPSADRDVALKCLRVDDPQARVRFLSEIRALGKVSHPNLVRIYTSGSEGDRLYYAMELVAGTSFDELKRVLPSAVITSSDDQSWTDLVQKVTEQKRSREPNLQPAVDTTSAEAQETLADGSNATFPLTHQTTAYVRRAAGWMRDIAMATGALHKEGIIHRDIKPENIVLAADGQRAVLMDLGIAKWTSQDENHVTRTREFVGSLRYASPEQVIDSGAVDHRSDIYSLGATLWEMLTLQPLFGIQPEWSDAQSMLRIELQEPTPARRFNRAVPKDLQAILQKCLEKNPGRRYATARELADDLDRYLEGGSVQARPVGVLVRSARRCCRRPLVPCFSMLLSLMAISLFAVSLPPRTSQTVRVGIKPWVGFSPLIVADQLNLCDGVELEFVPVSNTSDVRRRILAKELEAAPYLVDSHAIARADYTPIKVVLQLDVSLQADAMVVDKSIREFRDLQGVSIAYLHHEAPHFLLLALCEKHDLELDAFRHVKVETAKAAAELFVAGKVDAVVTYEPFVQLALNRPGSHRIASAADDPGAIIDVLAFREDVLQKDAGKVKRIIAGWMQGVELLRRGDPQAIAIACQFLGEPGNPITPEQYFQMAEGMQYGSVRENLAFFRVDATGTNPFQRRLQDAQERWDRHHQLRRKTNPAEGDGSRLFMDLYSSGA